MNNKSDKNISNNLKPESGSGANQSRRSFAKAGLLAPVILSLANRPAWGATNRCMVSGFSSAMEIGSGVPGTSATCNYKSASYILADLSDEEKDSHINTLFICNENRNNKDSLTIENCLLGKKSLWLECMVLAHCNSLLYNMNPLGSHSVTEVFNFFETNYGAYNFGNVTLTKKETRSFLKKVLPLEY